NSFAFESTDDRFIVHLTQPDGTRIQATTEHGRFLDQVVERSVAPAIPPRTGAAGAVPLPRPSIRATPARVASPSPVEDSSRAPKPIPDAPAVRPRPATTSGNPPPPAGATNPRPIAPASPTTAAAARAKPAADASRSSAPPAARSFVLST